MIKSVKNILNYFKRLFNKTYPYNKPNELSKYSWNKVQSGIFQDKELFLPKTWAYKVKNLNHEQEVFEVIKKVAPFSNVMATQTVSQQATVTSQDIRKNLAALALKIK